MSSADTRQTAEQAAVGSSSRVARVEAHKAMAIGLSFSGRTKGDKKIGCEKGWPTVAPCQPHVTTVVTWGGVVTRPHGDMKNGEGKAGWWLGVRKA